jgi:hypothetical protein
MNPLSPFVTRLSQRMTKDDQFCYVENSQFFPSEGYLKIGDELVYYEAKSISGFGPLKRGLHGSVQKGHYIKTALVLQDAFDPYESALSSVLSRVGSDLYLNSDGDLEFDGKGDIRLAEGIVALDLRLRLRVNSILNFGINDDIGIDAGDKVIGDEADILASVIDVLTNDEDVANVGDVSYKMDNHGTMYITAVVFVRGLNEGFEFTYKLNYKRKGNE